MSMLEQLKILFERHRILVNSAQYLLAGATYMIPASHIYHNIMTEALFALSKVLSTMTYFTDHRGSDELRDSTTITQFLMLSVAQFEVLYEKTFDILGGSYLSAVAISVAEVIKSLVRLHCILQCTKCGGGMIVGWGKSHPRCLYAVPSYGKWFEEWVRAHLPPIAPVPSDKWSFRFISVSSVSTSAFLPSDCHSPRDNSITYSRYTKSTKSVRWRDDSTDLENESTEETAITAASVLPSSALTALSILTRVDSVEPPPLQTQTKRNLAIHPFPAPILGSALKTVSSYEILSGDPSGALPISSATAIATATYYPSSRETADTLHKMKISPVHGNPPDTLSDNFSNKQDTTATSSLIKQSDTESNDDGGGVARPSSGESCTSDNNFFIFEDDEEERGDRKDVEREDVKISEDDAIDESSGAKALVSPNSAYLKKKRIPRRRSWENTGSDGGKEQRGYLDLCEGVDSTDTLPIVTTICGCDINAGQLLTLGEILYILRPAVYALLRAHHFKKSRTSTEEKGIPQNSDRKSSTLAELPPLLQSMFGPRDDSCLLFAMVVSLTMEVVSIVCTIQALRLIRKDVSERVYLKHWSEQQQNNKQWRVFRKWMNPDYISPHTVSLERTRSDSSTSGGTIEINSRDQAEEESLSSSSSSMRTGRSEKTPDSEDVKKFVAETMAACASITEHPMDAEIQRRKMMLLLYLLRSPIFDRTTLPILSKVCHSLHGLPLIHSLPDTLLDLLRYMNKTYFYTSNSS